MTPFLPVTATAIRAWRVLGRSPTRHWVDWAVQQLEAGRDGPNMRILAGLTEPLNYFEVIPYVDAALAELELPAMDDASSIIAYSKELITRLVEPDPATTELLSELAGLCVDTGYPDSLMPFYLLHYARQNLHAGANQHYWKGANASNVGAIIIDEARKWLATCAA